MSAKEAILDELAAITANLDQAQAEINASRLTYEDDEHLMHQLDRHQIRLNMLRTEIELAQARFKDL